MSAPRAVFAAILCLAALASVPCAGAAQREPTAAQARAEARDILSSRRYTGTTHGPFRGLLDRIGDAARKLGDLLPSLDRRIPGGRAIAWVVLIAIVAAVSWLLATRTGRRRAAAIETAAAAETPGRRESPAALERRAEAAEREGDYAAALRLRFRAGLLRLDARGLIEYRPSLATATVAGALRSPDFDRVAGDFDEIVYGGRPATEADARASREGWAAVAGSAR